MEFRSIKPVYVGGDHERATIDRVLDLIPIETRGMYVKDDRIKIELVTMLPRPLVMTTPFNGAVAYEGLERLDSEILTAKFGGPNNSLVIKTRDELLQDNLNAPYFMAVLWGSGGGFDFFKEIGLKGGNE